MTLATAPANFTRSKLLRVLDGLSVFSAAGSGPAFAERLGHWVDFSAAMELYAAQTLITKRPIEFSLEGTPMASINDHCESVCAALIESISASCVLGGGRSRIRFPVPNTELTADIATAFEPYRRFYLAHQNDFEQGVRRLRTQMHELLAQGPESLRQLATLDAAFAAILNDRESKVLRRIPVLLESRFGQLIQNHLQTVDGLLPARLFTTGVEHAPWLITFCADMRTVLLAELELRLQPVRGLIEAMNNQKVVCQ
jgi:hypothetical protein